jgi:predicted RNA-binding Zn ribbon-like protein
MGRPQAPGTLDHVRRFINTLDVAAGRDQLQSPDDARAWLSDNGLPVRGDLDGEDLTRLAEFREDLRHLIAARSESRPVPDDILRSLGRSAESAALRVSFGPAGEARLEPARGSDLEPARGSDAVIAVLLADIARAVGDGSWARLKVCANATCRWAFWDASRNRSGVWCTMAVCGNRMKGRAFRARAQQGPGARQTGTRAARKTGTRAARPKASA